MNDMSLFSITVTLFLIMDPVGNIASYLTLMRDVEESRRSWVLVRELTIAFVAMMAFNLLGEFIFTLLGISELTVRLASGAILFLVALKILFPAVNSWRANLMKGEPFIVPLAIPLIAGPSLLATIMLYADMEPSWCVMTFAIIIATLLSLIVLYVSPYLQKYLGNNGLLALEKLMGMVLILMAVQRFTEGIQLFMAAPPT